MALVVPICQEVRTRYTGSFLEHLWSAIDSLGSGRETCNSEGCRFAALSTSNRQIERQQLEGMEKNVSKYHDHKRGRVVFFQMNF